MMTVLAFSISVVTSYLLPPCNRETGNGITKVVYSTTGGRSGNYERLELDPDSSIYTRAVRGNEQYVKQKTDVPFWRDLKQSVRLEDFDKVQSDPGHTLYDGIDITITVEEGADKHSFVNGENDSLNYQRLAPFIRRLHVKLEEFRKKL